MVCLSVLYKYYNFLCALCLVIGWDCLRQESIPAVFIFSRPFPSTLPTSFYLSLFMKVTNPELLFFFSPVFIFLNLCIALSLKHSCWPCLCSNCNTDKIYIQHLHCLLQELNRVVIIVLDLYLKKQFQQVPAPSQSVEEQGFEPWHVALGCQCSPEGQGYFRLYNAVAFPLTLRISPLFLVFASFTIP